MCCYCKPITTTTRASPGRSAHAAFLPLAATWGLGVGTGVAAEVGADEPREGRGVGRAEYVGRPVGRAVDGWGDPVGARLSVGYDVVGLGVGSFDGRDVGADDGAHVPTAPRATPQDSDAQSLPKMQPAAHFVPKKALSRSTSSFTHHPKSWSKAAAFQKR